MISKTVNIDLNNITASMHKIPQIQRAIQLGIDDAFEEIQEIAEMKVLENLDKYGLSQSMLNYDIRVYRDSNDSLVVAVLTDYAKYVEYGTGLVGASSPHPRPLNWSYASGEHSSKGKGWWYPTDERDTNRTKKMGSGGDLIAFTEGMPSRPFIYDTWVYLRQVFTQIFRKHINRRLREVADDN